MIKIENGQKKYFDRNGKEITEGCTIKICHGDKVLEIEEKIYLTNDGELGIDATNPTWIERGLAVPCQYGIFPLTNNDTEMCEVAE